MRARAERRLRHSLVRPAASLAPAGTPARWSRDSTTCT